MRARVDSLGTNFQITKDTVWDRIMSMLQDLFDMRLVEHLAMPTEISKKQQLLTKFRQKMNMLHFTLKEIRSQTYKSSENYETRDKNLSRAALQSKYFQHRKEKVKTIEMMYTQVNVDKMKLFFEGSFKHYHKVAEVLGFPTNLDPIDIQEWAKNCQTEEPLQEKCCCQQGACCCRGNGCCCCCHDD